jgi:hypothetical protein
MIVNVNPYDTGYDENSHVMKFAALAKEVYITPAPAPLQRVPPLPTPSGKCEQKAKPGTHHLKEPDVGPAPYRRKVTISTEGVGGRKFSETVLEVLEGGFDAFSCKIIIDSVVQRTNEMMIETVMMMMTMSRLIHLLMRYLTK